MTRISLKRSIFYTIIVFFLFFLTLETSTRLIKFVKHRNIYWLLFGTSCANRYDNQRADNSKDEVVRVNVEQTVPKDGYYLFRPGERIMRFAGQKGIKVKTSSLGFRGKEISRKKPEGIMRIVCLGGSAVYGVNIDDDETYPASLEKCLGRDFEVINAGFPGANSSNILAILKSEILSLEPDIVILYSANNDHSAKTESGYKTLMLRLHDLLYKRSLFYTLATEKISLLIKGQPDLFIDSHKRIVSGSQENQEIIRRYSANITKLIEVCMQNDIELILATQPLRFGPAYPGLGNKNKIDELEKKEQLSFLEHTYLLQSKLMQELRSAAVQYKITVVDCAERFEKLPYTKRMKLFSDKVHLTSEGNKFLAGILCGHIKSRYE